MTSGSWPGSMVVGVVVIRFSFIGIGDLLLAITIGPPAGGESRATPGDDSARLSPTGRVQTGRMDAGMTIGEFSEITHLSIKTLRRYHETGLLDPAHVDGSSGYRYYTLEQVPAAQVIHRFRELDMPLREVH